MTPIAAIAADARLTAAYPGIAAAAAGLATPQIRRVATLGGNLAQRSRCWYFRNPRIDCLKKGGAACPAREGNHLYGVAFDLGPCVAPHPSTMAAALMAYDATVRTSQRPALAIGQLLGDGSDGTADNALHPGEMIEAIILPPPTPGERAAYRRAIGRAMAEWPLAEVVARVVVEAGAFRLVRLTAGGVAPVPIRLTAAEAAAEGASVSASDHRACGARGDRGREALADDGLQARAASGPRARLSGALLELTHALARQAPNRERPNSSGVKSSVTTVVPELSLSPPAPVDFKSPSDDGGLSWRLPRIPRASPQGRP